MRRWTRTPIVVISARSMEADKARALDLGADDYITKPFGAIELLASIRRKIEPNPNEPRYIFTEVGVGYRMAEGEENRI